MRLAVLTAFIFATAAFADEPRRGPPAGALTACAGLSEGTACAFTANGENLTGTCRTGPQGAAVACMPSNGARKGPHRGPPPEAVSACEGKQAEASCSFTHREHAIDGTCRAGPQGGALACAPARPPPHQQ